MNMFGVPKYTVNSTVGCHPMELLRLLLTVKFGTPKFGTPNDKIFNRGNHSIARWFSNFQNECYTHLVRFKVDLQSAFRAWLDAFS
jgi:hypothetical protein